MLYPDTDDRTASVREATSSRLPAYSPTFARSSIVTVATTPLVRLPTTKKRTSVADTTRQYTLYVELADWETSPPGWCSWLLLSGRGDRRRQLPLRPQMGTEITDVVAPVLVALEIQEALQVN